MDIALIASAMCAFLVPIAYVGCLLMNNKAAYLGSELPTGGKGVLPNVAVGLCILVVVAALS